METNSSPPVRLFLPAALTLAILGWGSLSYLVIFTSPTGGTRWLFFFAAMLGITGLALPLVAFLNRRFPSVPAPTPPVIVRQAIWFGLYGLTLAWLRISRILTPSMALLLGIGLVIIEWLLRLREKSLWNPEP
ncbi:MAG: hypothetical protein JXB15_08765 [Anaerolineales bacterium]|nr:hypothetical protein [Anaerolineales bacterium]